MRTFDKQELLNKLHVWLEQANKPSRSVFDPITHNETIFLEGYKEALENVIFYLEEVVR